MRLDRDTALTFQVHRIEHLLLLVAVGDRIGYFQKTIRERGLPMVDMGDDTEVTDILDGHGQSVNIVEERCMVNALGMASESGLMNLFFTLDSQANGLEGYQ